ncbi:spore coat protein U domain-containing protein [Rhodanobacter glycinis]|uniref:Spore coat protein U domain-containing protein n=1 Tax=Rhodanobacter glycinis TaxID=582702 RepID=A0A5B9DXK8_9GAMM|nr:spore coat U domain-containing protein [Rhodanobacter glycinis]QEE24219.1 spore coat protein U domain-containing protein [Rhodanobacter glycinis]
MLLKKTLLAAAMVALGGFAASAAGSTATTNFKVTLTITSTCSVATGTPADITFGSQPSTATALAASNSISVNCSTGTPYDIGLLPTNTGGTALGTGNLLTSDSKSADSIPYKLFQDSLSTKAWGNTVGTNTLHDTGTGGPVSKTVYATIASADFTPDSYTDTVDVTVTY